MSRHGLATHMQSRPDLIEARMQPVAVELDFMEPLVAFRRRVDQLRELRRDPLRQRGRA
jgi:hypothetical protein